MGQKVNPNSLRVGINKYWQSTWFEKKDYSNFLKEDHNIRSYIEKNYAIAGISSVIIERAAANLKIIIHTSKPGVLIGIKVWLFKGESKNTKNNNSNEKVSS